MSAIRIRTEPFESVRHRCWFTLALVSYPQRKKIHLVDSEKSIPDVNLCRNFVQRAGERKKRRLTHFVPSTEWRFHMNPRAKIRIPGRPGHGPESRGTEQKQQIYIQHDVSFVVRLSLIESFCANSSRRFDGWYGHESKKMLESSSETTIRTSK